MTPLLLLFITTTSVYCHAISDKRVQNAFVQMHNQLRRTVYPPAANMAYVRWNGELADEADEATCGYPTTPFTDYPNRGRNYFRVPGRAIEGNKSHNSVLVVESAVTKWFTDKGDYIYENNTCPLATKETCDAFRLIISPALSAIGCARRGCSKPRYHQFLCLYNKLVPDSSTPIYRAGLPGTGCVGRPTSGFSILGLCLTAHPSKYSDPNSVPQCLITCKNCATNQSKNINFRNGVCKCKTCLSGYSGADCSIMNNKAAAALVCGPCQQQGTPCLNKGVDKSADGKCICDCGTDWAGPQCEMTKDEYNNAIYLELSSSISNDTLPLDPRLFHVGWESLKNAVQSAINAFCVSTNITNVAKCCNVTMPKAAPTDPFLDDDDKLKISHVEFGMTPNGNIGVAILVKLNAFNKMCESKPNHNYTTVPLEVLLESLRAAGFPSAMTRQLSQWSCASNQCPIKLVENSVQSYKVIADDKYSNKDNTSAAGPGTNARAGPGTTIAATAFLALLLLLLLLQLATTCCQVKLALCKAWG